MIRTLEELERAQRRMAAYAQYEYVDAVFGTAGVDVVVPHTLRPGHPEQVNYELVKADSACKVYHDASSTRRPWGDGYIVLRSDVSNTRVRLRLSVEQGLLGEGQTTSIAIGSALPAVAVPFLVEHNANGTHKFAVASWTPTIGGTGGETGQVYAFQNGFSVKIGPLVFVSFRVGLSTLGTITNLVQVKGFPYTSASVTGFRARFAIGWQNMATAYVSMSALMTENMTAASVTGITAAATSSLTFLAQANLTNTTIIDGSGVYLTDQ